MNAKKAIVKEYELIERKRKELAEQRELDKLRNEMQLTRYILSVGFVNEVCE